MVSDAQKKYRLYKFCQISLTIIAVPLLIMALFSAIIMINSKSVGGYPSMFGYTVIEMEESSFGYTSGTKVMFQKFSEREYKTGDIIVYYSEMDDGDAVNVEFNPQSYSNILSSNASDYDNRALATGRAQVSIVRISDAGVMIDKSTGKEYYGYRITDGVNTSVNDPANYVFSESVLGKAIDASPFIISALAYCASYESFITLVLIPCGFLLLLQVITAFVRRSYEKEFKLTTKQKIRKEEITREGGGSTVPINNYKENLAQTVEGFKPAPKAPVRPQRPVPQTANAQNSSNPQIRRAPIRPTRPVPQKPTQMASEQPVRRAPVRPQRPIKKD